MYPTHRVALSFERAKDRPCESGMAGSAEKVRAAAKKRAIAR
jgi:hypothetical protein